MAAKKASEARPRKEKLAIYLAKDGQPAAGDLIKLEDASDAIPLSAEGIEATLYVKKERPKPPPPWTDLFTQRPEVPAGLFPATRSVGAALLVRRGSRTFALTFGTGFHLIKEVAIERDFGLRVTLSSVDPNKLRSVDKANYEDNPLNSRTQSTKEVDIFDLQMDSEMEMLYALTGISNVSVFGSHVSGRDSLTVAVEITLDSLFTVLDEAISRFDGPLPLQFEWVDNIRRVKDPEIAQVLDLYLDEDLKDPTQCVLWLGEPEVVDWEKQIGYSFDRRPNTPVLPVLSLGALMEYLTKQDRPLSVDTLRATSVHVNDSDYQSVKNWNAYRCLYAELHLDAERYMLRNGLWFQVEPDFVKKVDDYISRIASCPFALPAYDCDREDDYNKKLAQSDKTYSLMDKKNTKLGGRYDKVEFCDLIRNSSDLIHVKYYRSSSTLSHLFSQGLVAAEAFVGDEDFRVRLNQKLPPAARLADPTVKPKASAYTVTYAIATTKQLPRELPFFSKVTLRNAMKTLQALDYQVQITAIEVAPDLLIKKKCRPKQAPSQKT